MWKSGDHVALRGVYNKRVWYIQSALVVQDGPEEVALAILPGAECTAPEGYINGKHGPNRQWDRWEDYVTDNWKMQSYIWHTNRLLILLQPEKYYATVYFWQANENRFLCYYINFQLPFQRTKIGFDTLDLELDIIIEPTFEWQWKDMDDYQSGIVHGVILSKWMQGIEEAQKEIFEKLEKHHYPFDGTWLNWMPDPDWSPPKLPENWDKMEVSG